MKLEIILLVSAAVAAQRSVGAPLPRAPKVHYGPPPLPRELAYFVRTEARRDYWRIISNKTLTIGEQENKIKRWAEDNGIWDKVEAIEDDRMEFRNAIKKEVKHVIDFLPQAFKQFFRVVEDKNLTPDEITQRKRELKKLNPEVFRTLKFIFEQFMQGYGPYGNGGL